jgi:hypothetical protein
MVAGFLVRVNQTYPKSLNILKKVRPPFLARSHPARLLRLSGWDLGVGPDLRQDVRYADDCKDWRGRGREPGIPGPARRRNVCGNRNRAGRNRARGSAGTAVELEATSGCGFCCPSHCGRTPGAANPRPSASRALRSHRGLPGRVDPGTHGRSGRTGGKPVEHDRSDHVLQLHVLAHDFVGKACNSFIRLVPERRSVLAKIGTADQAAAIPVNRDHLRAAPR